MSLSDPCHYPIRFAPAEWKAGTSALVSALFVAPTKTRAGMRAGNRECAKKRFDAQARRTCLRASLVGMLALFRNTQGRKGGRKIAVGCQRGKGGKMRKQPRSGGGNKALGERVCGIEGSTSIEAVFSAIHQRCQTGYFSRSCDKIAEQASTEQANEGTSYS